MVCIFVKDLFIAFISIMVYIFVKGLWARGSCEKTRGGGSQDQHAGRGEAGVEMYFQLYISTLQCETVFACGV